MKITKKKLFQYSSFIIGTIFFVVVLKVIGFKEIVSGMKIVSPASFIFYIVVSFMIFSMFVLRWYFILKCHGHTVSLKKLFNYRVAAHAVGYLTPSARLGGEPVRVHYLIRNGISPEKASSSVVIDKSVELTANAVMTLVGALLFGSMFFLTGPMKIFLLFIGLGMIFLIWFFYYRLFKGKGVFSSLIISLGLIRIGYLKRKIPKIRKSELEMTHFFMTYKRVFMFVTFLSFIAWLLSILEYKLLLSAFGYTASPIQIFFVLVVVGFSYMMPVPAALGVLEGMQATLFETLGKGAKYGIAVSLVTRIRDMMWTIYGLVYLYLTGIVIRNILKNENNKPKLDERKEFFNTWKPKHKDD